MKLTKYRPPSSAGRYRSLTISTALSTGSAAVGGASELVAWGAGGLELAGDVETARLDEVAVVVGAEFGAAAFELGFAGAVADFWAAGVAVSDAF